MKNQNKILTIAFFLLCFAFLAFAQSCSVTSVSASSSTTRATTGTSATITASYSGSSCTSETMYVLSSGDSGSLTVSDPSAGYYSGVSSGSSKTFVVTASTAGTYQYWSTVSSSESTKSSVVFVAPSVITISGSPSSAALTDSGQSVKLNITLSNPGAAVDTSYRLVTSSGLSVSGDPANTVTALSFTAGSSTTLQWTLSSSACFSGSKTATLELGSDTNVYASTITYDCPSSSNPNSGTTNVVATPETAGAAPTGTPPLDLTVIETEDGKQVSYARTLDVDRVSGTSTVNLIIKNEMSNALENFEYKERIPESVATDSSQLAFSLNPTRFEKGSIIAVWSIDKLDPGESISISYSVNKVISSLTGITASVVSIAAPGQTGKKPVSAATKLKISGPVQVTVGDKITLTVIDEKGAYAVDALVKVTTPLGKVLQIYANEQGKIEFTAIDAGVYSYSADIPIEGLVSTKSISAPPAPIPFLKTVQEGGVQAAAAKNPTIAAAIIAFLFSGVGVVVLVVVLVILAYYYKKKKKGI